MTDPDEDGRFAAARQRARDEIASELSRARPIQDAQTALQLIAESALRFDGGPDGYRIVDEKGNPRFAARHGEAVPFTIPDLVAELRERHPTLFEATGETAEEPPVATAGSAPAPEPPPRDWLLVTETRSPPPSTSPSATARAKLVQVLRGRAEMAGAILRSGLRRTASAARSGLGRARATAARGRADDASTAENRPPRKLRVGHAVAAAAAALFLLAVGYVLGTALNPPGPKQEPQRTAAVAPPPDPRPAAPPATPPEARPAAPAAAPAEPNGTASVGSNPPPRGPLAGVPEVIDTATLRIQGRVVRLFGVEWARGAQGDDLGRYLRGREVKCSPARATDVYRCEVEGKDLSEVVLYNGGGRATGDATPELVAAETHAKTEKLGVWKR